MQTVHFPFSFASQIVLPTFGYWSDMHPITIFLSSLEYPESCQFDSCTYITAAWVSWSFDSPLPPIHTPFLFQSIMPHQTLKSPATIILE